MREERRTKGEMKGGGARELKVFIPENGDLCLFMVTRVMIRSDGPTMCKKIAARLSHCVLCCDVHCAMAKLVWLPALIVPETRGGEL